MVAGRRSGLSLVRGLLILLAFGFLLPQWPHLTGPGQTSQQAKVKEAGKCNKNTERDEREDRVRGTNAKQSYAHR